jgi:2-haloacid dehalogenase
MPTRPQVVAFDIIGTVFSLEPMRAKLIALGLPSLALEFLYTAGLRDTFAMAASTTFAPFLSVLRGCLDEVLAMHGLSASSDQKQDVLAAMKVLPAHEDAQAAFEILATAGIRIFALSNGSASSTSNLLSGARLSGFVEQVLSVEDIKLSKPRPEVYLYAAQAAAIAPEAVMLVAAHPWDVHGAKVADLMAGYVARKRPFPSALKGPDVSGDSLVDVARQITGL